MRRTFALPVLIAAAMLSLAACADAQSPQGPGPGPGAGPGRMGAGPMMGGRWGPGQTPGWSMMSPAERDEHHRRMEQARTYDDCRAVMDEHRARMQQRGGAGGDDRPGPRSDACEGLPR
jgi:hypothetical protein